MPITEGGRFSPTSTIVSPGVFTRENDLSGLAQGVADIGAAIVAPFPKGPGFTPTIVESSADLESLFGVADGVYYGPYTSMQYLLEKGFVTVCRVGALTGYEQKFPFVVYGVKGLWNRATDAGWTNPTQSLLTGFTWSPWVLASGSFVVETSVQAGTTGSYSGSVEISNVPLTVVLRNIAATGVIGTNHTSGSLIYSGDVENLGTVKLKFDDISFQIKSLTIDTGSVTPGDLVTAASTISIPTGSIFYSTASLNASGGADPFGATTLFATTMSYVGGICNTNVWSVEALVQGTFGYYDGTFTATHPVYDPCSASWSGAAEYKILAVLADTQNAPVDSQLVAPGFSGSTMISASNIVSASSIPLDFNLTLKNTNTTDPYGVYNFSLEEGSTKYITSVFGKDPTAGNPATHAQGTKIEAAYLYKVFENSIRAVVNDPTHWFISGAYLPNNTFYLNTGEPMNFTDDYSLDLNNGDSQFGLTNAFTPWVISQEISPWNGGDPTRFKLFRVATLSDGTNMNTSYKIEISNVKLASTVSGTDWGTFTLTIRAYSDTDKKPKILQQFPNLSLDPDSSNFIARRIGDRYNYIDFNGKILQFGTYDNNSRYIRIEMNDIPYPVSAVPYGFDPYTLPVDSSAGYWLPPIRYTKASVYSSNPGKYPSGVNFDDAPSGADDTLASLYPTASVGVGTAKDNRQYFAPIPAFDGKGGAYSSVGRNVAFALDTDITSSGVSGSNIIPAVLTSMETTYVKMRKFVFGFQGGFDGQSPAIPINVGGDIIPGNTQGLNCTNINSAGSIAYKQCIAALGNADEFDINMIVTPGIIHEHHSYVTNLVVEMCEARGDCFYIMDLYVDDGNPSSGQIDDVINLAADFDTNYAAAYYPWVKIKDSNTNKIIPVPPSVVLPGVYAANDKVAGEWWAVAGLNRGGITQAVMVTDRTTHSERDDLYEGRVNPIAAFPGQGIVVWGQKTLQVKSSALDRINVRRLLIEIKKYFASTGRYLVFEQSTAATWNRFLGIVNPFLQSIQQRSGLYAFEVVMDSSNNTPDLIDQNILYGQIWLKPTKTAEFVIFDFNITSTGATFGTNA